jgi:hypothetical protein
MPTVLRTLVLATGLAVGGAAGSAQADTVYNAAAGFAASSNSATSTWQFGQTPTLGGSFTRFSSNSAVSGLDYWAVAGTGNGFTLPGAFHNATTSSITYGTVRVGAGQLMLHPGERGQYSVARFTAPVAGTYTFSATFMGLDYIGQTTTDVHLQVNSSGSAFSGVIANSFNIPVSSGVFTVVLAAGGTIDAAVGRGSNGTYFYDSTGVDFNVRLVPLPAGVWAGGATMLAVAGVGIVRRRRHV